MPDRSIRRRTGATEQRPMRIRDGRPLVGQLSLDQNGFVLVEHRTAVTDFFDTAQLEALYYPEVQRAGAGCIRRLARRRVRSHAAYWRPDRAASQEESVNRCCGRTTTTPNGPGHSGSARSSRKKPSNCCSTASRSFRSGERSIRRFSPTRSRSSTRAACRAATCSRPSVAIPDRVGETYQLRYNPDHQWFYFPQMRRDEAIVFKVYDSQSHGRARFTPHTSFIDPTTPPNAPPRQSIEVRTFAFFAPAER